MKKKIISVLLASTMVFSLAACGGGDDGSKDSASKDTATEDGKKDDGGSSDGEEKLTVWCWDKNFNMYAIDKAAELYQKDHPNFTVEQQEIQSTDIEVNITNRARQEISVHYLTLF